MFKKKKKKKKNLSPPLSVWMRIIAGTALRARWKARLGETRNWEKKRAEEKSSYSINIELIAVKFVWIGLEIVLP